MFRGGGALCEHRTRGRSSASLRALMGRADASDAPLPSPPRSSRLEGLAPRAQLLVATYVPDAVWPTSCAVPSAVAAATTRLGCGRGWECVLAWSVANVFAMHESSDLSD